MASASNYDRAYKFYSLLQRRPSYEKPDIIKHLKETGSLKAVEIIEGTAVNGESSSSSFQPVTVPSVAASSSNVPKLLKDKPTTYAISKLLNTEGGEPFQEDNNTLVGILKMYELRKDVPKVHFTNYPSWKRQYKADLLSSQQVIQNILNEWVSANGNVATVGRLIYILNQQHLNTAASKL